MFSRPSSCVRLFPSPLAAAVAIALLALSFADPRESLAQPIPFELRVTDSGSGSPLRIDWTAETNGFGTLSFTVEGTTSLATPFVPLSLAIGETSPFTFLDATLSSEPDAFYRIAAPTTWTALAQSGGFSARASGSTDGLATVGFAGAVFDGRHVYFVPYKDALGTHGRVLRYDSFGAFSSSASWRAFDASGIGPGGATGYTGGVFDGRYVYFAPQGGPQHGKVLRYDTQGGGFTTLGSWAIHDAGTTDGLATRGFQGAVFDGRHVYFVPHNNGVGSGWNGIVLRYDTTADFDAATSWQAWDAGATGGLSTRGYSGGVFDGRFVHFVPTFDGATHGRVLRYDTTLSFQSAASWSARDSGSTDALTTVGFKGGVFDGRFVYYVPYTDPTGAANVLRYDTTLPFTDAGSWSAWNASVTDSIATSGFDGAVFDGRRILFVPYQAAGAVGFHGRVLGYDTTLPFRSAPSWDAVDAGATLGLTTKGYVGAAFDGRFLYFAPYRSGAPFHGNVLRFDAKLPRAIPSTVCGGSTL